MRDDDNELERDIGYALARSALKVKGQRIEALRLVAAGVVAHLRLAGWRFSLRTPDPLHGPSGEHEAPAATGDALAGPGGAPPGTGRSHRT